MSVTGPGSTCLSHWRPCQQPELRPPAAGPAAQVSSLHYLTAPFHNTQHTNTVQTMTFFVHPRPTFSLDVKTRAPEGLLFFAATRQGRTHLALYLSKGRIRLSIGKQKEIFNREKYNDGKWHSVSLLYLIIQHFRAKYVIVLCVCGDHCVRLVDHIQSGEEEIPLGCGWDQGPGRSDD